MITMYSGFTKPDRGGGLISSGSVVQVSFVVFKIMTKAQEEG